MATVVAVLQGSAAARSWEKRGREPRGFYPLPWFGLGRSEVSGPREPVAAGRGALGGGAAELGRRRAAAEVVVVVRGCARGLFIGEAKRWSGRGAVEAGELGGAALMALGVAARRAAARFAAAQRQRDGSGRAERRAGHGRRVGAQERPAAELCFARASSAARLRRGGASGHATG